MLAEYFNSNALNRNQWLFVSYHRISSNELTGLIFEVLTHFYGELFDENSRYSDSLQSHLTSNLKNIRKKKLTLLFYNYTISRLIFNLGDYQSQHFYSSEICCNMTETELKSLLLSVYKTHADILRK